MFKQLFKDDKEMMYRAVTALILLISLVFKIIAGANKHAYMYIQDNFWTCFTTAALLWIVLSFDFRKYKEGIFFIVFALWAVFICLDHKYYLFLNFLEILFLTRGFFAFPSLLKKDERELFLKIVSFIYTGLFDFLCVIGMVQAVAFVQGKENAFATSLNIIVASLDNRLRIMLHPNTNGICFCIGMVLAILLFVSIKNIFVKIYSALSGIIYVVALSISDSRTALVAGMLAVGICAAALLWQKQDSKAVFKKLAVCCAAAVVSMGIVLAAGTLPRKRLNSYALHYQKTIAEQSLQNQTVKAQTVRPQTVREPVALPRTAETPQVADTLQAGEEIQPETTPTPTKPPKAPLSDRGFGFNGSTLNGRTIIWDAGLQLIENEPKVLWRGYNPDMDVITQKMLEYRHDFGYAHTHSGYLYVLIAFGIPGILILFAFLLKMAINTFKVVFLKKNTGDMAVYLLCAIVVALLFGEMLDVTTLDFRIVPVMPIFFLSLGYLNVAAKDEEDYL